jgi:endonuclease/exonuclease/phosphatase family metal-dependent hydrolase
MGRGYHRRAVETRVRLLVRTWNIAHGRDVPPAGDGYRHVRRKLLREMVDLATGDRPDILLLQEVPVWAGDLLREASGMGVTMAAAYGAHVPFLHVPLPLAVGAAVGRTVPDLVRTQVEGQANATLYGEELLLVSARRVQLNERRRLRGEPRIAHLVRLRHRATGREFAVGNVHGDWHDSRTQIERAAYLLEQFARGAPAILAGDFNAGPRSAAVRALVRRGWREDSGEVRADHILVRGMDLELPATRWPESRRDLPVRGGVVRLSDHDPVDAVVALDDVA